MLCRSITKHAGVLGHKDTGLRTFQRFRLVKFMKKFKMGIENLETEKIIAFDKHLPELLFVFYFDNNKNLFLILNDHLVADLTHFSINCSCFYSF